MAPPRKKVKLVEGEEAALPTPEDAISTMAKRGPRTDMQGSKGLASIIVSWRMRNQIVSSTTPRAAHGDEKGREEEIEGSDDGGGESDEEGEYDWEAEAQKPMNEKGYQRRERRAPRWKNSIRSREMVWKQKDGHLNGEWRWTKWEEREKWEKRVEDGRERAIRAWHAANVPQEVLLRIIECLVGPRLSFARKIEDMAKNGDHYLDLPSVKGLRNIALVCRAWCTLISPVLYSNLKIRDRVPSTPVLQSIAPHARRIFVESARPYTASARFSQVGPRPSPAVWLEWRRLAPQDAPKETAYPPLLAVFYAQLHRSYSNVVRLDLTNCTFFWSSDLLRLLASFSALERVGLWTVSVDHVCDSVIQRERSSTSTIRYIFVEGGCTPSHLPFLARCWTWPCKLSNQQASQFHGLIPAEQRLAARFPRIVDQFENSLYYLDAMDINGVHWVAWVDLISLHVEFHALQHDSLHPAIACVRYCLLRVQNDEAAQALTEGLSEIGDILTRFAYLESIVLETSYVVTTDEIQSLLESLRKVCRVEVLHRTCDEGHKIALQAKKSPSRSVSAGLLSPHWCLEEHVNYWENWLSDDYWKSLKDEDKRGWDPSRPRTTSPAASK